VLKPAEPRGEIRRMTKRIAMVSALVALAIAAAGSPAAAANHYVFEHASLGPAGGNGSELVNAIDSFLTSSDGTHVFFDTPEALTPDDTDAASDIYRRSGGTLQRVSVGPQGGNGPHGAFLSGVSDDGSVVVFITGENLVAADTDSDTDLYKRSNGTTTLLTTTGSGPSSYRSMSQDGSRVFFESFAHYVDGDEETAVCSQGDPDEGTYFERPCYDIYQVSDDEIRLVSTGPSDDRGPVDHFLSDISADGSTAVFESDAALLPEDTDNLPNSRVDIYKWEDGDLSLVTNGSRNEFEDFVFLSDDGGTVLFTHHPPGEHGNLWESSGGVARFRVTGGVWGSFDNRYFGGATSDAKHVFWSTFSSLVAEDTDSCPMSDTGGCRDTYTHSFDDGIRLVTGGGPIVNQEEFGRFYETTRDGKKAYFLSGERLDPADVDSSYDIYEYDLASGARKLVSTGPTDTETKNPWYVGASEDGSRVFFYTQARMVPEDVDNFGDIYERAGNTTSLVTNAPGLREGAIDEFNSWSDDFTDAVDVSLDGSKLAVSTYAKVLPSDTDFVHDIFSIASADLTGYPRPKSAFDLQVALVQAATPCTAPNEMHGPPLAYPSCSPPVPQSTYLNAGVGGTSEFFAKSTGIVRLDVVAGSPGGADDSDVAVRVQLTNVWWSSGTRVDYGGGLQARIGLRITDKDGAVPSTLQDRTLAVDVPCTTTPDDTVGSTCSVLTSADAVSPGIVPERTRAIWGLDKVQVLDGGSDGDVRTSPNSNRVFAVQGVFVP
jgi:hypothetical protein